MAQPVFEKIESLKARPDVARHIGDIALILGQVTMDFKKVKRVPRYDDGERESDIEHSFMLDLVATEIAAAYFPNMNTGLVSEFCKVHDIIELETGDVNTFNFSDEQLLQKQFLERQALHRLIERLPPHHAELVERYERQDEPEARLVKAVDKILPFTVDIIGDGVRIMSEDNGIRTREDFLRCLENVHDTLVERFGDEFPEIVEAHQMLGELFSHQMPELPEQDYLFDLPLSSAARSSS